MRIQVIGKHIDIGDALRSHTESRLDAVVSKYSDRAVEAMATYSRQGGEFRCEATVHLATGLTAAANGRAHDIYQSFDKTSERLDKQLRRYKRRLKDHHKTRQEPADEMAAASYVLASAEEDSEPESLQPVIVAETTTKIQSLSVGEAVMQLEVADAQFVMFRNDAHGGLNIVFRREDGNIGWIDANSVAAS